MKDYTPSKGQQEVMNAISDLIRLATRHKIAIAGFAFAVEPPMISQFANTKDARNLVLYETLLKMCNAKIEKGEVDTCIVEEVN
jgi:hypothetical protein